MPLRRVTTADVGRNPHAVWNACVEGLAASQHEDLTPIQRVAWLCFWYDAEVNNGGHSQYFTNTSPIRLPALVQALAEIGASECSAALRKTFYKFVDEPKVTYTELDEYIKNSYPDGYEYLDGIFHGIDVSVIDLLGAYVNAYQSDFGEVVEG